MPGAPSSTRSILRGLGVLGAIVILVWLWRRDRRPPEPPPRALAPEEAEPVAVAPPPLPEHEPAPRRPLYVADAGSGTEEDLYVNRMAETKRALLEKTRYPIGSRPLLKKTDLINPHHVEPTFRGLNPDPGKSHKVLIVQNQDRVWLSPAQSSTATITVTSEGAPAQLTVQRSDLTVALENGEGGLGTVVQSSPIAHPVFLDDGNPPDAIAGDGVYSATVTVPPNTPPAALVLAVDATANDESGTLYFNFTATAPPPAVFTQTARDALEEGSVAVYVGITVQQAGTYGIVGRLYDSTGLPLVYMRFLGELTAANAEVRLLGFGKVILDEGGVPPFVLRDVEGSEMLIGQYPDRAPMAEWLGPYTTAAYPLSSLSDAEYNGADKQRKIEALDQAAREGVQNIRAGGPAQATGPTTH